MFTKINSLKHSIPSWLSWPAWLRALAIAPLVAVLWLAVIWANMEAAPW